MKKLLISLTMLGFISAIAATDEMNPKGGSPSIKKSASEARKEAILAKIAKMKPGKDVAPATFEFSKNQPTQEQLEEDKPLGIILKAAKIAQRGKLDKAIESDLYACVTKELSQSLKDYSKGILFESSPFYQRLKDFDLGQPWTYTTRVNDGDIIIIKTRHMSIAGQEAYKKNKHAVPRASDLFIFKRVNGHWLIADKPELPPEHQTNEI